MRRESGAALEWRALILIDFDADLRLPDLTHLSMSVGLYLHPLGMLAIQSLRLPPPFGGLGSVLPYRSTLQWHSLRTGLAGGVA